MSAGTVMGEEREGGGGGNREREREREKKQKKEREKYKYMCCLKWVECRAPGTRGRWEVGVGYWSSKVGRVRIGDVYLGHLRQRCLENLRCVMCVPERRRRRIAECNCLWNHLSMARWKKELEKKSEGATWWGVPVVLM